MQVVTSDADVTSCSSPATPDKVQAVRLETGPSLDSTTVSQSTQVDRADGKLLFGNGRLDRWLSERRALHKRPKLNTLDCWLSPGKTTMSSLAVKSPSNTRTRTASPEKSPVAPRQKIGLQSSDSPRSPSTDIRKYFRSHVLPPSPMEVEHTSDSRAEDELTAVTVIDLVEDSPPRTISDHSCEVSDEITSLTCETAASESEAIVRSPASCRQNSNTPDKMRDSGQTLDWWATSRTKSSTRKGPFKRSLGLVHFVNEVRFCLILLML